MRLVAFVNLWYSLHGITLKDSKYRYARTIAICERLGNPLVSEFTASDFARYRQHRLLEVSAATVNHEARYLRSVFNELARLGHFSGVNPLSNIRSFPEPEYEFTFLDDASESLIFDECGLSRNVHCLPVARLCLATGARWNEANNLLSSNLSERYVRYVNSKNGRIRTIPIIPEFSNYLRSVANSGRGRLFNPAMGAFRCAVARSGVVLPRGQLTHVLRHTFATRLLARSRDIVVVQKALGHSDIKLTQRYAHMTPDHLSEVIEHSPLSMDFLAA